MNERARIEREAQAVHEVAVRAIWRLDILEWVILGGAMLLAIGGGAAVAWLIAPTLAFGFRPIWTVMSVLLFVVPGVIAIRRMRKDEREARANTQKKVETEYGRR